MRSALFHPLAGLLVLLSAAAAIPAIAQTDPRQELLRLINAERRTVGAPPLRLSAPLTRAAQEQAAEVARRNSPNLRTGSAEEMWERLERVDYQAHSWTESLASSPEGPAAVLSNWRRNDSAGYRELLASEVRDIGIGIDRLRGMPLYAFIFAVPQADHFARGTAGIRDMEKVRAEMLALVNAARKKAGAPPLRTNERLDQAAQRHAEDMLARGYFAHQSPEGKTVRERAQAAGYKWRTIGENIAEGQFSVDEVMDTWMNSPGHRRNILNPDFRELGIGLTRGKTGKEHRVVWVQAFGTKQ
ncbi:MAG TPA: CAP domain-containing protein [Thermoanaerobaculia bacterium]|nr:CAP domain-containing protein [Thermoanaerobaculia bacterium]